MAYADALRSTTWTGTDVADLIEGIFVSGHPLTWTTWSPTHAASGSMTFTSVTADVAKYIRCGKLVLAVYRGNGMIGGTPSNTLYVSLPVAPSSAMHTYDVAAAGWIGQGSTVTAQAFIYDATAWAVTRYDSANFSAGSLTMSSMLIYEAA